MKPAPFEYHRAGSAAEAVALLDECAGAPGGARLIAGGQSLGPMLNLRLAQPGALVDVSGAPDLRQVGREAGRALVLGAALTHAEIEDGMADAAGRTPAGAWLASVARGVAYRAVRNRGTLGGSLAHADPSADWPVAMLALGAEVDLGGPVAPRRLGLGDFLRGPLSTALDPGEVMVAIRIPLYGPEARWSYEKFCVKSGEFALASAAVLRDPERGLDRLACGALDAGVLLFEGGQARDFLAAPGVAAAEDLLTGRLGPAAPQGAALRLHAVTLCRAVAALGHGRAAEAVS